MASETPKKITVKTSDNELFDLDEPIAMEFGTLKSFLDENPDDISLDTIVPIQNVSSETLTKIITYCKKHLEFRAKSTPKDEVEDFDAYFVRCEDNGMIKVMMLAAHYLNVKELLDLLIEILAERIKDKSVEYVREYFGVENDFTPEEEAMLRQENEWTFEGIQ